MKAASSAEHMKVLAVESSNAESFFQQLDKLRIVYEDYVKMGKETIPNAERDLRELTEELVQKSNALDDVRWDFLTSLFLISTSVTFHNGLHFSIMKLFLLSMFSLLINIYMFSSTFTSL